MSAAPADPSRDPGPLGAAVRRSLDGLLAALVLEPRGDDRFGAGAELSRFTRVFGGQTIAQALTAAAATATGRQPASLHAYFVAAGRPGEPIEIDVQRVRDGRSLSVRQVTVHQGDRTLLSAMACFADGPTDPQIADPPPSVPSPEETPGLQTWIAELPPERREAGRAWEETPPPVELRIGEPPNFMGGPAGRDARSHWMRLPRSVGDDPVRHAALLAYASDYLLLDMALRAHPDHRWVDAPTAVSLDHSIWFHRPVRFDRWHLHTQYAETVAGERGLVRGAIHDEEGRLVASVAQATLTRSTG
jgi:acyl-CoA thioesterase II